MRLEGPGMLGFGGARGNALLRNLPGEQRSPWYLMGENPARPTKEVRLLKWPLWKPASRGPESDANASNDEYSNPNPRIYK